jgi:hypothetical protein
MEPFNAKLAEELKLAISNVVCTIIEKAGGRTEDYYREISSALSQNIAAILVCRGGIVDTEEQTKTNINILAENLRKSCADIRAARKKTAN